MIVCKAISAYLDTAFGVGAVIYRIQQLLAQRERVKCRFSQFRPAPPSNACREWRRDAGGGIFAHVNHSLTTRKARLPGDTILILQETASRYFTIRSRRATLLI